MEWENQFREEPIAYEQHSWQTPPLHYNEPNFPLCEYQPQRYERYPIHDLQPPNFQPPHPTPPWNQVTYTPYHQPYEPPHPYTPPQYPYLHDTPSHYTTFLPTFEPSLPSNCEVSQPFPQELQDLQEFFQEQEGFRRKQGEFMATIAEAINCLASLRSSNQDISLEECGGATKECREEDNMEPQGEEEEPRLESQKEEGRTSKSEEVKDWVLVVKGIQGINGARSNLEKPNIQVGVSKVLGEVVHPRVQVKVNKRMIEKPKMRYNRKEPVEEEDTEDGDAENALDLAIPQNPSPRIRQPKVEELRNILSESCLCTEDHI
ncbi:protein PAF1 homolog [Arachis ipaensis]|uniref:protein PAF1 homolog n=1 Tax=Arachis ipaensis TaxID=130454 RepID=UPI0007AF6414|nr:protein PAF1 homolog [Arachis ipaensis]